MQNRRTPPEQITPAAEDKGLFKNKVGSILVEVIPQFRRNTRQDIIIRGFAKSNREIEVVVAGRRTAQAIHLEAYLKAAHRRMVQIAAARNVPLPAIETMRCQLKIEGAWRPRLYRDTDGAERCVYQLLTARWSILDGRGQAITFGALPLALQPSLNV